MRPWRVVSVTTTTRQCFADLSPLNNNNKKNNNAQINAKAEVPYNTLTRLMPRRVCRSCRDGCDYDRMSWAIVAAVNSGELKRLRPKSNV